MFSTNYKYIFFILYSNAYYVDNNKHLIKCRKKNLAQTQTLISIKFYCRYFRILIVFIQLLMVWLNNWKNLIKQKFYLFIIIVPIFNEHPNNKVAIETLRHTTLYGISKNSF